MFSYMWRTVWLYLAHTSGACWHIRRRKKTLLDSEYFRAVSFTTRLKMNEIFEFKPRPYFHWPGLVAGSSRWKSFVWLDLMIPVFAWNSHLTGLLMIILKSLLSHNDNMRTWSSVGSSEILLEVFHRHWW